MSQQLRQYIDLILKGVIIVLFTVLGFMFNRLITDVDLTHDSAIRTEGNLKAMERMFDDKFRTMEREIDQIRDEVKKGK